MCLKKKSKSKKTSAPGGVWTRDLRITSAPSAAIACTAYKYDALTDCATGAGWRFTGPYVDVITQFKLHRRTSENYFFYWPSTFNFSNTYINMDY